MTPPERSTDVLRDAMYQLALVRPVPDAETLDQFVRRYPEHAEALTAFAVELAIDALAPDHEDDLATDPAFTSPLVSRAMSRFHNRLYSVERETTRDQRAVPADPDNPFVHLDRKAFRELVETLNANTVFAIKLRDRLIDPATISPGFQRHVANQLAAPPEVVAAHFAGRPRVQLGAYFKADQKPEAVERQSFEEAVRNSGLSPEQQEYLLKL